MTTSWGEGTEKGPAACIKASSQVELYDPLLPDDLPCGLSIHTAEAWGSEAGTLLEQLDSIRDYAAKWLDGDQFPVVPRWRARHSAATDAGGVGAPRDWW
ncbi:MAG: hypothetical protein Ct9H300mP10_01670 [Methanobacteriota archaeon]|nr:MAG: hypothetical protein Ct9H300mP10_01670 [Euryarchaeota archaeon]